MAKQPFDFNRFLLEKGEKVGLGVCALFMLLMVAFGVMWVMYSNSPQATARELEVQTERINSAIKNNKAPEGTDKVNPELLASTDLRPVGFSEFVAVHDYFQSQSFEDSKRQRVDVLAPSTQPTAQTLLAPVRSLIISLNKDEPMVEVIVADATAGKELGDMKALQRRQQYRMNQLRQMAAPPGMGGMPPAPGMAPPMAPGAQPPGAMAPGGFPSAMIRRRPMRAGQGPFQNGRPGMKLQMVKWDDKINAKFAETIDPRRMAIVSFEFPYRKQLEQMQYALRHPSIAALLADPDSPIVFRGFNVERAVVGTPGGPIAKPNWKPLDLDAEYKPVLMTAVELEREDDELYPVLVKGLTIARPALRDVKYPRCRLPGVLKTLEDYREKGKQGESAVDKQNNKLSNRVPSLFERPDEPTAGVPGASGATAMPPAMGSKPVRGGPAAGGAAGPLGLEPDLWVPEYCLLRFVDVDVKPGYTYQYRVQVKMLNPNYKKKELVAFDSLAEKEELVSEWSPTVATAQIPDELYYYVVDQDKIEKAGGVKPGDENAPNPERNPDMIFVQVHRWLQEQRLSPSQDSSFPIGNWAVSENKSKREKLVQQAAFRGEFIGHRFYIELPVWDSLWEAFYMPSTASRLSRSFGIPVDFSSRDILIDFEGGRGGYQIGQGRTLKTIPDECPVEVLVLTADGKLDLRNSRDDSVDETRLDRLSAFRAWVEKTREEMERLANGGQAGSGAPEQLFNRK